MDDTTPVAGHTLLTMRPDQDRDDVLYRVTPVKGARVEGTIEVGMSCHEIRGGRFGHDVTVAPCMRVHLTPDDGGAGKVHQFTVNGKVYGDSYLNRARVEFHPRAAGDHRDEYYRRALVGGVEYYMTGWVDHYDQFSDAARKVITALVVDIAAEYVTSERWHAKRVDMAQHVVDRAQKAADDAAAELDKAQAALEAVRAEA